MRTLRSNQASRQTLYTHTLCTYTALRSTHTACTLHMLCMCSAHALHMLCIYQTMLLCAVEDGVIVGSVEAFTPAFLSGKQAAAAVRSGCCNRM